MTGAFCRHTRIMHVNDCNGMIMSLDCIFVFGHSHICLAMCSWPSNQCTWLTTSKFFHTGDYENYSHTFEIGTRLCSHRWNLHQPSFPWIKLTPPLVRPKEIDTRTSKQMNWLQGSFTRIKLTLRTVVFWDEIGTNPCSRGWNWQTLVRMDEIDVTITQEGPAPILYKRNGHITHV